MKQKFKKGDILYHPETDHLFIVEKFSRYFRVFNVSGSYWSNYKLYDTTTKGFVKIGRL